MPVYMDSPAREEQTKKERASLLGADGSRTLPDPSTLKDGWVAEHEGMNQWPHANLRRHYDQLDERPSWKRCFIAEATVERI